jgi:hypothetical protein
MSTLQLKKEVPHIITPEDEPIALALEDMPPPAGTDENLARIASEIETRFVDTVALIPRQPE